MAAKKSKKKKPPVAKALGVTKEKLIDHANAAVQEAVEEALKASFKPPLSPLLPDGTRFFRQYPGRVIIVRESKPGLRTLKFSPDVGGTNGQFTYRLALPYVQFFQVFDYTDGVYKYKMMGVFFTNRPLTRTDDMLGVPPLPNTVRVADFELFDSPRLYQNLEQATVCMGKDQRGDIYSPSAASLSVLSDKLVTDYWNLTFGGDLQYSMRQYAHSMPYRFRTLQVWEKESAADPMFPLSVNWIPGTTVDKLLGWTTGLGVTDYAVREIKNQIQCPVNLAPAIARHWDSILEDVAIRVSHDLSCIDDKAVRTTARLAYQQALRKAIDL